MNLIQHPKKLLSLAVAAAACLVAQPADAAFYHVTVDTTALQSASGAPYALDFQLTGGNSLTNTVTISNFSFVGGAATNDPVGTPFGLASGSLQTGITLSDSAASFYNDYYQGFTPGTSLSFDVNLTTNVNGPTPDGFGFSILDKDLFSLDTNNFADLLFFVNIDSASPIGQAFTSVEGVTVSVSAVPEPASAAFFATAVVGALGVIRRRREVLAA